MQVYKFGGASVKNAAGVQNLAHIIQLFHQNQLLVVISAMGKTTNALEDLYKSYLKNENFETHLNQIKAYHDEIIQALFHDDSLEKVRNDVNDLFVEIEWLLEDTPDNNPDYIYDQIVSAGELLSTRIVAHYLQQQGFNAIWIDARNYIKTDNTYKEGQVDWEQTQQLISTELPSILEHQIIITQGFIGGTSENYTTTLGREGSDYSAAIFASCLNAEKLSIWKDVPGVLNADPKWFDETEKIPQLSYYDAIELTYYGATVIHPKTIKPLQNKNIPLHVRSFLDPQAQGTLVNNEVNPLPIPSFIFKVNQLLISILPKDYSFIVEDNLSQIFQIFHQHRVKIHAMQNTALSFSVCVDHEPEKTNALLSDLLKTYNVKYNEGVELVTIRYYNTSTIERVTVNKKVFLESKNRHTCQMVMKNI